MSNAPRDTDLSVYPPNSPWFAKQVNSGTASLTKYTGADDEYAASYAAWDEVPAVGSRIAYDVPQTVRHIRVDLTNTLVTTTGTGTNDGGGTAIVSLPDRNLLVLQAELVGSAVFSGDFATNDDPLIGVGTVQATAGPVATTKQNVIPAVTCTNIVKDAGFAVAGSLQVTLGTNAALLIPDAASQQLFLNVSAPDGQLAAAGTCTFTGYLDLFVLDLANRGS